ncbi:MAG: hypothetical protein FJ278_25700, partial [Planctomycetes bacterium]|nr:hypothetical protein [Planctomycetota bacterium]
MDAREIVRLTLTAAFVASLGSGTAIGQASLVPNPSFEDVETVDTITAKTGFTFEGKVLKEEKDQILVRVAGGTEVPWKRENIEKTGKKDNPKGWTFHVIQLPVADSLDKAGGRTGKQSFKLAIEKQGGKGFLHSAAFAVKPGAKYNVSAWIKGSGAGSVEVLWWEKYDLDEKKEIAMSKRHRDVVEPKKATADWQRITGSFTAPEDAAKAYVRLVGLDGDV